MRCSLCIVGLLGVGVQAHPSGLAFGRSSCGAEFHDPENAYVIADPKEAWFVKSITKTCTVVVMTGKTVQRCCVSLVLCVCHRHRILGAHTQGGEETPSMFGHFLVSFISSLSVCVSIYADTLPHPTTLCTPLFHLYGCSVLYNTLVPST